MPKQTNHLIHETSPYLLQHAHNPVQWYPWGAQALEKAKKENKPILVSIGYSACHWCHVMERESFEDEETARVMNEHFINIKIDREERPDLDHIYMDAVQAMTGHGGWPLNVFLTPDLKPFYGGTYFPPKPVSNRPSWQQVLSGVSNAFNERRDEVDQQAANLTQHILQSNAFGIKGEGETDYSIEKTTEIRENIMKMADREWGGFGQAPKFPQTFTIQFLLRNAFANRLNSDDTRDDAGLQQALLSLDKMIAGGIYDQIGGGFARYSTDAEWLAPHFEKMLYDNALLIAVLSEAYLLTRKERYKEVIKETMEFIQREMMHSSKGFYAALDADSEGEEGKFYVWDAEELKRISGSSYQRIASYFDISEKGNWEHKNILRVLKPIDEFIAEHALDRETFLGELEENKKLLLEIRNKRIRPGLDDKIILGWNALMNTATSKAFEATGEEAYRQLAIDNMRFILEKFSARDTGRMMHTWKNEEAKYPAFLDDYAFLIQALIHLQEITGDQEWLKKAGELTTLVIDEFDEVETGYFFYTGKDQQDVIVRKKEVYDGAVPSGNSVMAYNLYRLSILFDRPEWKEKSRHMVEGLLQVIIKYPTSFGVWGSLYQEMTMGTYEIAVTGKNAGNVIKQVLNEYIPHRVFMASEVASEWPMLSGKTLGERTSIWLCEQYRCNAPVGSVDELITLINKPEARQLIFS